MRYVPVGSVQVERTEQDTAAVMGLVRMLRLELREKDRSADSLFRMYRERVTVNVSGDTLRHDRERVVYRSSHLERDLDRLLAGRDSVILMLRGRLSSVRSDSVGVPYPVERRLTRWERWKMRAGGWCMLLAGCGIPVLLVWMARRFRRK